MASKSKQIQIRVTPREKAMLKRLAAVAGQDLSSYLLARALAPDRMRFERLLSLAAEGGDHRYALAEINDFLTDLAPDHLREAVVDAEIERLSPLLRNYIAAMVEQACYLKGVPAPAWTARVEPLANPHFAAPLASLRLHLLRASPVPFKRRNIFVDSAIGARV